MRRALALPIVALLSAAAGAVAGAQSDHGTPSPQAVKAAAAATRAARQITLETRHGSGVQGSVDLYEIGRTRSRILVRIPHPGNYRLQVYPGTDCVGNRTATEAAVALNPTNFNRTGASQSSTIVSLPLSRLRSGYVLDVRDATNGAAVTEACARLNR